MAEPTMARRTIDGVGLNVTGLPDGRVDLLDGVLAEYRDHGCDHVELVARRLDLVVGGRVFERRVEAVGEAVARAGLGCALHASHALNFMDPEAAETHMAVATASVEACRRLGARSMVVHSGVPLRARWEAEPDRLRAAEREALARLGDAAGEAGVRIALENMIAKPTGPHHASAARPSALAEQLDALNHEAVGACLDFGHAWLSAQALGFDYLAEVEALAPWVWHLHLHDNCGLRGASIWGDGGDDAAYGLSDMHAPMFLGTIPWESLLPRLRLRERTFAGVELGARWSAERGPVVETARSFAAFLNGDGPIRNPYAATAPADAIPAATTA